MNPSRGSSEVLTPDCPFLPAIILNARKKLEAVRKVAKLFGESWSDNGLRHSFASYHLASFNSAAALALEMGHTGTDMISAITASW